jgi:hydrogenase maturation protein HypF
VKNRFGQQPYWELMTDIKRQRLFITGRVQGVGFRPAVYRIAERLSLTGFVYNDTRGVTIELQGPGLSIDEFCERLRNSDKPAMAQIKGIEMSDIPPLEKESEFIIRHSETVGATVSEVTPDIATCADCLAELADKKDFRYRYPFINCTNCGPRYSIVKTIPYDRPNTTMGTFEMCEKCRSQYTLVSDRRFHAQPVACCRCGPRIWLCDSAGQTIASGTEEVIEGTVRLLGEGKIVAIKGIGGFHLAVDALNDEAVERLRQRKRRDHKPFAMMADSIQTIEKYAVVSEKAKRLLESPQAPIVLLPKRDGSVIAPLVAEEVNTFGFMLCYAPLHFMLFEELRRYGLDVLVATSGNISDEPLICKNELALERLGAVADVFLMHDREIYRQVDDSIVHFIADEPVLLRRARGYVPQPIILGRGLGPDIFAAGADLKNTFCFVKAGQLICSEHTGDMADAEVYHHYIGSIEHLRKLFEVEPKMVVCDLHPGYLSRQYAFTIADGIFCHPESRQIGTKDLAHNEEEILRSAQNDKLIKVIEVQHHWAHIASVLAENNLTRPVIGLACDGTGFGTDGAVWGCECLIASLDSFERFGHLEYYPLAGGDLAVKEAVRPVLGLLKQAFGDEFRLSDFSRLLDRIEPDTEKQRIICEQIDKGINVVQTSSLGRLFDAVAAIIGLGNYNHFEAQLPMALEAAIDQSVEDSYGFELTRSDKGPATIDLRKMTLQLVDDIKKETPAGVISARFHNTIAVALAAIAERARHDAGLDTVAISGGCFCNRYLANRLIKLLKTEGFCVLFNRDFPSNDGGIALGQAAVAAATVDG